MLGWLYPEIWIIGAGLELAYLFLLTTNKRFCNLVDGTALAQARSASQKQIGEIIGNLSPRDQGRYEALAERRQDILHNQTNNPPDIAAINPVFQLRDRLQKHKMFTP